MANSEKMVKASIPRELQMKIVKIQASDNLDWEDACLKASGLLDKNGAEYKRLVNRKSQRIYKSRFMTETNKFRNTVKTDAMDYVRRSEDNFRVPCNICGKPMYFSSNNSNWEEAKPFLYGAFKKWAHTGC